MKTGASAAQDRRAYLTEGGQMAGTPVRHAGGEPVGRVARILVDKLTGEVAYAVVALDRAGPGEPGEAVLPWKLLQYDPASDLYETTLTDAQIRGAPARAGDYSDPSFDPSWEQHVHDYFDATPYWGRSEVLTSGR